MRGAAPRGPRLPRVLSLPQTLTLIHVPHTAKRYAAYQDRHGGKKKKFTACRTVWALGRDALEGKGPERRPQRR